MSAGTFNILLRVRESYKNDGLFLIRALVPKCYNSYMPHGTAGTMRITVGPQQFARGLVNPATY